MKKEINIEIKKVWWDICTPEGYPLKEKRDMEIIFYLKRSKQYRKERQEWKSN